MTVLHLDYGKIGSDGTVEESPDYCVITGTPLHDVWVRVRIAGTDYFFGMQPEVAHQMTPEVRERVEREIMFQVSPSPKAAKKATKEVSKEQPDGS